MKNKIAFFLLTITVCFTNGFAQNFWVRVSPATQLTQKNLFTDNYKPADFISFRLNQQALLNQLASAPAENSLLTVAKAFIVYVPNSKGEIERYSVTEAPVMEDGLAAKYPGIKTYAGKGLDEPTSTIRFDVTPEGFHGMIISAVRKTIYINPVDKTTATYIVFDRDARGQTQKIFDCKVSQVAAAAMQGIAQKPLVNDGKLRTFRLAVPSGGEFSALFLDGAEENDTAKKEKVLAGLVTNMVRLNGIMETDFGIRLKLVNKEDTLIYINPKTDPFLSKEIGYDGIWGKQSQQVIDSLIGDKNYDLGHLLMGFNTGGDAGCIGCVCESKLKGKAVTGLKIVKGDPFVVDFWLHELGHQFGANHTFDYSYENTSVQMEPGSGSTIMGYAGVADAGENVQFFSDPYFHAASIQQVLNYVKLGTGAGCAAIVNTTNHVPVVNAGKDYVIPRSTPFKVTGSATDEDASDSLTYCWEQFDNYVQGLSSVLPKPSVKKGPVFRSLVPVMGQSRFFPSMVSILDGTNKNQWEALPSIARKLTFRLTVRDNQPGHGSTEKDDMVVTVDSLAGPFKVTFPNTQVKMVKNTAQNIQWLVNKTDVAPVNCSNVRILLSTNGGESYDYTLASSVANNGTAQVTLPDITSKNCRIMVSAIDNIFFDISDSDFSIANSLPVTLLSFNGQVQKQGAILNWQTTNEINNSYFEVQRSPTGRDFTKIGSVAAKGNNAAGRQQYTYTDVTAITGEVYYRLKQVDKDGVFAYSNIIRLSTTGTAKYSLYPNPAKNKTGLHISAISGSIQLRLTNAAGRVLFTKYIASAVAGQVIEVPLTNLAKGVYLLNIITADGNKTEKVVVE